jgi:PKD repeat protein
MKKFTILLLALQMSVFVFANNWVGISSPDPIPAKITLLSSSIETSVVNFHLDGYSLKTVQTPNGPASIILAGNSTPVLKAGAPDLPKLTASLIIPDQALMEMKVVSSKYIDYEGITIAPSKGNFSREINPDNVPYIWGSEYQTNRFFPESNTGMREPFIMRDFRGQTIIAYPFQYNPVSKVLRVFTDITVEVYKLNNNGVNTFNRATAQVAVNQEFQNIYNRFFLNFPQTDYTPLNDFGKMLVISYGNYMSTVQPLVDWKNSIGIPTELVNVSTIGTTAASIKSYIANYYNTNGLAFVLLVGDGPQIPTNSGGDLGGPSDNAYGYIVGNDHYIDLFVGRFSAENVAQVQTQVTRSLDYEKNPSLLTDDWYTTCLGIGSDQGPGDDNEYDYQHIRNQQTKLLAYNYTWNPELFDGSQGGNDAAGNPTPSMVSTEVNGGTGIIVYTGHGSQTSWGTTGFSNSNVNQLTNAGKLPFIWSVACVNGDFTNGTCFAEAWLRASQSNQPTGAIAFLGSTINQSWNSPMEGQDEMTAILVETYSNNIKRTFGGLSMNGCSKMIESYGTDGSNMADTWLIFGDPSLMVRTDNPANMTVSHNPTVFVGSTSFVVTCNVPGARVTVSNDGVILGTAYVTNGSATVDFAALSVPNDTLTVSVVNYNYIPYLAEVPVIPASGPYLVYENNTVSDAALGNGNGMLDYAELTKMTIGMKNIGVEGADNTDVRLRTNDAYITVTDSVENYGLVPAGQIVSIPDGFEVQVADDVPDGHVIQFTVVSTSGSQIWSSVFTSIAHAPVLTLGNVVVTDPAGNNNNIFEAGETVDVSVTLNNNGSSEAFSLIGDLTTTDPNIIISTVNQDYGDISPLSNNSKTYIISALPTAPAGYVASMNIAFTGEHGITGVFTFDLVIGRIPVLIVDLDGNANSGNKMKTALEQLNVNYEYTTTFPSEAGKFGSLFVCLGVYPNKHILTSAEGESLKVYLNQGGRIYMEGGDTWYFDQTSYPTPVHPMFNVKGLKDNGGALATINGKSATFTAGMSFAYGGDNNYIDKIAAENTGYSIMTNSSPLYDVAVASEQNGYKTIGSVHEFGGLTDNTSPSTKKELMQQYLDFFGVAGNMLIANFVGIPQNIQKGEIVAFTDLSSPLFTSRIWTFENGIPATSTEQNPGIKYETPGEHDVVLEVSYPDSTMTTTKFDYIVVADYTGVVSNSPELTVTVYPNPSADGNVFVNCKAAGTRIQDINVYNLTGGIVYKTNQLPGNGRLNLTHLDSGIYLLKIDSDRGSVTQKLIIK